jgi:hypothetical protein
VRASANTDIRLAPFLHHLKGSNRTLSEKGNASKYAGEQNMITIVYKIAKLVFLKNTRLCHMRALGESRLPSRRMSRRCWPGTT